MRLRSLTLAALLAGCQTTVEGDPAAQAASARALVAEQFGSGVDADLVVATVGAETITAAEVAAYLDLFPALTTAQAVDDLVDLHRASTAADEAGAAGLQTVKRDAELRGRALAFLRNHLESNQKTTAVSDAKINEALNDPAYSVFYGLPERIRATHLLVIAPPKPPANAPAAPAAPTDSPAASAARSKLAADILVELRGLDHPATALDLRNAYKRHLEAAKAQGIELHKDEGMVFPRRFSGRPRWQGAVASVVDPFADACFNAKVGDLLGPVETEFGLHLIVVEARYPEVAPPTAERRARVARFLTLQARQGALKAELDRLAAEQSVVPYPENIRAVSRSAVDQVKERSQTIAPGAVQRP
jgi:hypothetical protein